MGNKKILLLFCAFASCRSPGEMEYEQYLVNGQAIYQSQCANCHGKQGEGLQNLYPALNKNPEVENLDRVICLIRYGQAAEGSSNGQAMPPNRELYNLDIAQLLTYMLNDFADTNQKVSTGEVKEHLQACP